jgi:hypothetical protein
MLDVLAGASNTSLCVCSRPEKIRPEQTATHERRRCSECLLLHVTSCLVLMGVVMSESLSPTVSESREIVGIIIYLE